jgi:hypothetical protein
MTISRISGLAVSSLGMFALTGLAASVPAMAAPVTAVSFDSSTLKQDIPPYQFSLGYTFTTGVSPLSVTSIGYLNDGGTGNAATHQLQIYQITSGSAASPVAGTALLANPVIVTTVGSVPTYNTFSYTDLSSPLSLLANTSYEIVGNSNANGYGINAVNSVFTGITYGTTVYTVNTTTPAFNSNTYPYNNVGDFGPNFKYAAVPEASSAIALGLMLAFGGLAIVARRRGTKA